MSKPQPYMRPLIVAICSFIAGVIVAAFLILTGAR